jgi:ParE-like toxin of type II ParDE toxin-antitoxin system
MRVIRHPEVPQELEAAACWYQDRLPGLGDDFLAEYQATLTRILQEPTRWRKIRRENRKLNFRRFPYAIVYSVGDDVLYVTAVMHLHRRPFYWVHREIP